MLNSPPSREGRENDSMGVDFHPPALDAEPVLREQPDREREEDVFLLQDSGGESLRSVVTPPHGHHYRARRPADPTGPRSSRAPPAPQRPAPPARPPCPRPPVSPAPSPPSPSPSVATGSTTPPPRRRPAFP